ncbi:MAG TPA: hypothetical protein VKB78_05890 [Pirellulales bacterium]|nr:hypothetical protein [Pirellulales bacterium]
MRLALLSLGIGLIAISGGCNSGSDTANASSGGSSTGWKEFAPEGEHFSIKMPGDPKPLSGDMSDTKGWTADGGNLVYKIRYTPLADPSIEKDQGKVENQYDLTFDTIGIKDGLEGLQQTKSISFAGNIGREIVGVTADKKFDRIRLCIVGGRLYRADLIGSNEAVDSGDAKVFFDSLKIVP